jgi:GNAT superfamily N-acetyltransferase
MLGPLSAGQREQLLQAMRTVERLLSTARVEIRLVDPASADARQCLRAYFAELNRRSDVPFDPTKGTSAEPHELRAPAGAFLIAYLNEEPIGCGALKHNPGGPSDLKRMWVAETARGLGIGRRLLGELEQLAREHGAVAVRLDTNRALTEAITMYRSSGYVEVPRFNDEPFAHHWFLKPLEQL